MNAPAEHHYNRIEEATRQPYTRHAVRDFRVVLESVFRNLTAEENRSFSNLYGRIEYVFDRRGVEPRMRDQVHALRILANRLSHDHRDPTRDEYLLALKAVCMTVEHFCGAPVPASLSSLYASLGDRSFVRERHAGGETVALMKPIILEVGELRRTSDGRAFFTLRCREEEYGDFDLQLWQMENSDLVRLQPLLRPWQTLYVSDCRRSEGREGYFSSTGKSQIVLEPDILVDISDLAECFSGRQSNPLIALIRKLMPQEASAATFKGNMVNTLLDEATRTEQPEFKTAFRNAVAEHVLQAVALGREELNSIYENIRTGHWDNVISVADSVREKPVRIEPSFLSARYGLQGRLDLLVEDADDPLRKDVYELKSGKAPDYNVWSNNEMQVVGYNLLMRSAFGQGRTGSSAILYSAAAATPLRNVTSTLASENRLLAVRNVFVAHLLAIAAGDDAVLDSIRPDAGMDLPSFLRDDFGRYHAAYSVADELTKTYYRRFLGFVLREFLNAKCGLFSSTEREEDGDGFAALWLQDEETKALSFGILRRMRFSRFEEEVSRVHFLIEEPQHHNFRIGDTVIIYPRGAGGLAPLEQQVLKARIDRLTQDTCSVSLNNRQLDASYFERDVEWVIEHDLYESNHWHSTRSLFNILLPSNRERFDRLIGRREPVCHSSGTVAGEDLNDNQRQILRESLDARDYHLVQGPPGTGKTSTYLTRLSKELLADTGSIVIVAFTNRAVDEIALRLTDAEVPFIRLGGRQSRAEAELSAMVGKGKGGLEEASERIRSNRVFLATVATMNTRLEVLARLKDDLHTLIVDEASQLTEPALIGLVMRFRKFILIGDQNQLPPVVTQSPHFCRVTDPILLEAGIRTLDRSLFERMIEQSQRRGWSKSYGMLTTHFRMHAEIASLIDPWYGHRLRCGSEAQRADYEFLGPEDGRWKRVLSAGRVVFIPSPHEMTSKYHDTEARRIVSLLKYLRDSGGASFKPEHVGVVTPWRTQIGLIRNLLGAESNLQEVNIDTVERFQGSENRIILVSMAVYHPAQLALLRSPGVFRYREDDEKETEVSLDRKLLVTLSRAKQQILFFGDERVLKSNPHYASVIERMQRVEIAEKGVWGL